jgi:hypothetical protein
MVIFLFDDGDYLTIDAYYVKLCVEVGQRSTYSFLYKYSFYVRYEVLTEIKFRIFCDVTYNLVDRCQRFR